MNPRSALPAALLLATLPSCLYLPPLHHTHGAKRVTEVAESGPALDRASVEGKIGTPGVLRKAGVYVYDWEQSYGYFFVGAYYTATGGEITGKRFHVLVRFDGDLVQSYEWDADPPLEGVATRQPPLDHTPAGPPPTPPAARPVGEWCLAYSHDLLRCLVTVDAAGRAFASEAGPDARRVAPPWEDFRWEPHAFVSADERRVVALAGKKGAGILRCGQVWDLAAGTTRRLDEEGSGSDRTLCRIVPGSDAGGLVAVRDGPYTLGVLDSVSGKRVTSLKPGFNFVSVAIGGDRIALASGPSFTRSAGDVALFQLSSGRLRALLDGRGAVTRSAALSADGRLLAVASAADVEIWDVWRLEEECGHGERELDLTDGGPTRALLGVALLPALKVPPLMPVVAVSPAGDLVAAAAGPDIRVVRPTGEHVAWLPAGGTVTRLRFDGSRPQVLQVFRDDDPEPATFDLGD